MITVKVMTNYFNAGASELSAVGGTGRRTRLRI